MDDAHMIRRSAAALCATLLLAGCGAGEPAGAVITGSAQDAPAFTSRGVTWEAGLDAEAPFMNVEGEAGAAMPGECWMQHGDGAVQVQLVGSSIPEPTVESVEFADGVLTLTMVQPDEGAPSTMDFVLHQFMVSGVDAPRVTGVVLVRGEDADALPEGELVEPESVG